MGIARTVRVLGLAVVAILLGGCTAGSPDAGVMAPTESAITSLTDVPPTSTAAETVSAAVASPSPTGDPADSLPSPVGATIQRPTGDDQVSAPTPRPAVPADPGQAITVDGSGTNDRLQIALTFDAGADRGYGEAILDYLRDEGVTATFGMTGRWAEENQDLVARMAAEGHQLMNHSYSHESFNGRSTGGAPKTPDQVMEEVKRTEEIVKAITGGYEMKPYFRFPYGDWDEEQLVSIYQTGYYLNVYWTCDSWGWKTFMTAADVAWRCTTEPLPHEITLLHVGADAAADFEALPALIDFYREQGYEFVTVEQMLQP